MEEEMKLYMQERVNLVKADKTVLLYVIITEWSSAFVKAQDETVRTAGYTVTKYKFCSTLCVIKFVAI